MSQNSEIEWTEATWNPVTGCDKVSPGCANCYAEGVAKRFWATQYRPVLADSGLSLDTISTSHHEDYLANGFARPRTFTDVQCHEDRLEQPLHWKRPRKIFVNSMSDLFHEDVPDAFIDKVFDVMWRCPQHTFQILTKRVDRMVSYVRARASRCRFGWVQRDRHAMRPGEFISLDDVRMRNMCGYVGQADWACDHPHHGGAENTCDASDCPIAQRVDERSKLQEIGVADEYDFGSDGYAESNGTDWLELTDRPLHAACENVWLGFSAENQRLFEERARLFRALRDDVGPNFVLFVSLEPLLGPINFTMPYWPVGDEEGSEPWSPLSADYDYSCGGETLRKSHLDWVIVGGESGQSARPCGLEWARSIVRQCQSAGVPVFVKQLGDLPVMVEGAWRALSPTPLLKAAAHRKVAAGIVPLAFTKKGSNMSEWPEDLRVRQFPAPVAPTGATR